LTNSELKYYEKLKHKKYRDEENKFLIEGVHIIEECLKSEHYSDHIEKFFLRIDFKDEELIKKINTETPDIEITFLENKKFNKLSETENSQGVIASVNKILNNASVKSKIPNLKSKIFTALDRISDPGNLGTIIRTCHWFGINDILISENSADIYNSKVIRSSQGALLHVNVRNETNLVEELKELHKNNFEVIITDLQADKYLSEYKFETKKNYVLVFGSEANGISNEILDNKNYHKIKIKGYSDCESLNVAVSSGIVINEVRKFI